MALHHHEKRLRSAERDMHKLKRAITYLHDKFSLKSIHFHASPKWFDWDDFAQQIVGATIVSLPFLATEEVWVLAKGLSYYQLALLLGMMLVLDSVITHYTKFNKVSSHRMFGIPIRVISLVFVSFSVNIIMLTAIGVFGPNHVNELVWGIKLVVLLGFFSSIGASTVDLVR